MENKLARFLRNTGKMRFFIPIGIILIAMGLISLINAPAEYLETIGTITDVDYDQEDDEYDIDFTYEVLGQRYEGEFSGLSDEYEVGDNVAVYYDPQDPSKISNTKNTRVISAGMISVGILALVFSVISGIKAFRKSKEMDERLKESTGSDTVPEVTAPPRETLKEYYVMFDGHSLNPGYKVEDGNRAPVYEAPMTKNNLIGNRIFTFTDMRTGKSTEHQVGHTVTSSYSNEFFSESSWFNFDGVNIWDCLHDRGIRISTDLRTAFPKVIYTVSLNGRFFATIETSSKYVHEEDELDKKIAIPVGKYFYRCWTDSNDMDLLFLTVFAISETEQTVVE